MFSDVGPEGVRRSSLRSQVDIKPLDYRRLLGKFSFFSVSAYKQKEGKA